MIQVNIIKNSVITNSAKFDTQDLATAWLTKEQANGSFGDSATYTVDQVDLGNSIQMAAVRVQRDVLLSACDYTQLPDNPLTSDQKTAWLTYRQALRVLPDQPNFDPTNFTWPATPG